MEVHHAIQNAERLFDDFASRHGLIYEIDPNPPIDVLWTLHEQPGLALPVTLGLQNGDELNFGVGDFWSFFFPFEKVPTHFDELLDAWVNGNARVARRGLGGQSLQRRIGDDWKTVYNANVLPWPFRRKPHSFLLNSTS